MNTLCPHIREYSATPYDQLADCSHYKLLNSYLEFTGLDMIDHRYGDKEDLITYIIESLDSTELEMFLTFLK